MPPQTHLHAQKRNNKFRAKETSARRPSKGQVHTHPISEKAKLLFTI